MYNMHEKTMDAWHRLFIALWRGPALPVTDSFSPCFLHIPSFPGYASLCSIIPSSLGMPPLPPPPLGMLVLRHHPPSPGYASFYSAASTSFGYASLCSITPLASPVGTLPPALSPLLLWVHFPLLRHPPLLWIRFPLLHHPLLRCVCFPLLPWVRFPLLATAQGTSRRGGQRNFSLRRSWRVFSHSCRYVQLGSSTNFGVPRRNNGNVPALSCTLLGGESRHKRSGWTQRALPPDDYRHQSDYCNVRGVPASTSLQGRSQYVPAREARKHLLDLHKIVAASWCAFSSFLFEPKSSDIIRCPRSVALTRHLAVLTPW